MIDHTTICAISGLNPKRDPDAHPVKRTHRIKTMLKHNWICVTITLFSMIEPILSAVANRFEIDKRT